MVERQGGFPGAVRCVPLLGSGNGRVAIGLVLLLSSFVVWHDYLVLLVAALSWFPSVLITEKYVHKYPQRYYSYLWASHAKAALIMGFLIILLGLIAGLLQEWAVLGIGFAIFFSADLLVSALHRRLRPLQQKGAAPSAPAGGTSPSAQSEDLVPLDSKALLAKVRTVVDTGLAGFIAQHLPDSEGTAAAVLVCDPESLGSTPAVAKTVGLIVSSVRMNDVRRINRFLLDCTARLPMGGYFVCGYSPYEKSLNELQRRYSGPLYQAAYLLHFARYRALPKIPYLNALYFILTGGKGRVFSKVELWGRLSYCGMHVVAETGDDNKRFLIARKTALPSRNPRPSYYPVVALEKVGLDGEIVRLHKVRSMYPFSEFLQKRIFEDNGLASTGKFANDFRLTEYGNFIRKYWIDELPQIWDWLRGDIKLVGMRATSRHYLSLYPQELYDLYIQIKPGLIPPIFDEKTDSFDKIVEVEMAYLTSYMKSPLKTDVGLFFKTFTDIFFRGVRSK